MSASHQVTLEWGAAALEASHADVTIIAAAARASAAVLVARAEERARRDPDHRLVLLADFDTATDAAGAAYKAQLATGERVSIAIIAVGDTWPDGSLRPSAGDELVAGAVVDTLCDLGIDFHSPACAIASAAWVALRGAARSLTRAESASRESTADTSSDLERARPVTGQYN